MKSKIIISLILSLLILIPTSTITFAEKGDFYEKHQSELDNGPFPEGYIDVIKSYDSTTNSFECGMFDINCKMLGLELSFGVGIMNFVADGMQILVLSPDAIVKDPAFNKFKGYISTMSTTLLTVFLIWQIMVGVAKRFGDPDDTGQLINQKLLQVFAGAAFLGLYEQIFSLVLGFQYDISNAILTSGLERDDLVLMVFKYSSSYSVLFAVFMGVIFIVFSIALIYRFVAIGFFYVVGPAAIATIVNEEFNYFTIWWRYIVNNVVTFFMQCMAFSLSIAAFTNQMRITQNLPWGVDIAVGGLLAVVMCFFALVIPSILGNLGSATGTGRALGKLIRYATIRR